MCRFRASFLCLVCISTYIFQFSFGTDSNVFHTIAFGSCNNVFYRALWSRIEQALPNKLILLGDTIYADFYLNRKSCFDDTKLQDIKQQYKALGEDVEWRSLLSTLGGFQNIIATFDDHDYGVNNADRTFPFRNESQQLFWDFIQLSSDSPARKQSGVYSSQTVHVSDHNGEFVYKVISLDTRSNKDPTGTSNGDFLGEEQWEWLWNELADTAVDLLLLASSIQVLPTDKLIEETWNEFPAARVRLLKMLVTASKDTDVVILSGDVHCAEVLHARCSNTINDDAYSMFEFTSSGISQTFLFKGETRSSLTIPPPTTIPVFRRAYFGLFNFIYQMYQV